VAGAAALAAVSIVMVANLAPAPAVLLFAPTPSADSSAPDDDPTIDVSPGASATATGGGTGGGGGTGDGGTGGRACQGPDPQPSPGTWQYASGGPTFGRAGGVRTYRVAVESTVPVSVDSFTAVVDSALGESRGWTGNGTLMLRRVSGETPATFTVFLASAWTACRMCLSVVDIRIGGVPYTSCQTAGKVIINADRYLTGSPKYLSGYPLDLYRLYAINHEVGHQLGYAHVRCPGSGQLAPIMQQQTLGLQGCRPNPWPYPHLSAPPPSASSAPDPSSSPEPEVDPSSAA